MMGNKGTLCALLLCFMGLSHGFLPSARLAPHMKVGKSSDPSRAGSRSIGILNSMRENINSNTNPTQAMFSNLPFDLSTEQLEAFAAQAGEVVSVKIITDKETGRSKGYGFVVFNEALAATYAIDRLDGMELGGRPLKVRPAIRKMPFQGRQDKFYGDGGGY